MDETSFIQGNSDGNNPQHTKGWLWVLVTPLISYFQVWLSRSQAVAQSLLGYDFKGILTSDRYGAYNWLEVVAPSLLGTSQARFYPNRRTNRSIG